MMKRHKLRRRYSAKIFSRTARKTHKKNLTRRVMRGGIRL